jgi:tetratricopeptide (TPR) repeat protein
LRCRGHEGGDIRGRQSAAIVVVSGTSTGKPWVDRKFDLRVEDHPTPVPELRRLVRLQRAYNALNEGDGLVTAGDMERAMAAYTRAMELVPDEATNGEAPFWVGITLASIGREADAIPYLKRAQARDARWRELVGRLPASGLLPSAEVAARLQAAMGS